MSPSPSSPSATGNVDRRGEAHLWLLLEEALRSVRDGGVEPWEAWRNFRAVADALVATHALDAAVAGALVGELDDALAVRGVVPAAAFRAAPWPDLDVLLRPRPPSPPDAGTVWLEAEVERHLDLFVSFGADAQTWAAADLLRILAGPTHAFVAVGLLRPEGLRLLDEVRASLAAAGVEVPRAPDPDVLPREEWVEFLGRRPGPVPDPHEPSEVRALATLLGRVTGAAVRVDALAWSDDAVQIDLTVRRSESVDTVPPGVPWHVRVRDDRGRLHLGQPVPLRRGAAALAVALRPGLEHDVKWVEVRASRGGERVEATIPL